MPYIPQKKRAALDPVFACEPAQNAGELNFQITQLVQAFLKQGTESYARYNAAIGALECAKLELYRRKLAPYENQKIFDNGDVYGP